MVTTSSEGRSFIGKLVKYAFQNPMNLYGQYMNNNMGAMGHFNNANANMAAPPQQSMPTSLPNQGLPNPQPQDQTQQPQQPQQQQQNLNKPSINLNNNYKPFQPYGMGGSNYIKY